MRADGFPANAVALDELLGGVARGLRTAQGELDRAAFAASEQTVVVSEREIHLRPLWFVFQRTTLDLEISTITADGATLSVRPIDPLAVALRGHAAAAGTRLHVEIAPLGFDVIAREL